MSEAVEQKSRAEANSRPNWSAVFAVAFCVACLITVEFLPVSLLTPMAQDLGISEGVAGQSVTVTAFVAMFASLFPLPTLFRCCSLAAPVSVWRLVASGRCRRR